MATSDDLERLNAYLRPLAGIVYEAADALDDSWVAVVLDARFSDTDGSISHKVRVEQSDGSQRAVSLPAAATLQLLGLDQARATGKDRWYGLVLRVTATGECDTRFNYDPACAEDASFYKS